METPQRRRWVIRSTKICGDGKRFADSGGWGYGAFEYDPLCNILRPANLKDKPPQGSDAKCGFACQTIVKTNDYVFTDYGHR
jgi:hypothetical protein